SIYQHIKSSILTDYKNTFIPREITTITGKMEGLYAWLDINYLFKNFQNNTPTVGSVEFGGASTQIAFALDKSNKLIDEVSIDINNQRYHVFSKSFLGLGINEARESMNADEQAHFCYPLHYKNGKFELASC